MKTAYDIQFRDGYRIVTNAENMADAIILGKAEAINSGHSNPKLSMVTLETGGVIFYCTLCGESPVNPNDGEDTCYNCLHT